MLVTEVSGDVMLGCVHLSQNLVASHHLGGGSFNLVWCGVSMIQCGYGIRWIILMLALRLASLDGALFREYLKFLIGLGDNDQWKDEDAQLDVTYMYISQMVNIKLIVVM